MGAKLLDGKQLANSIKDGLKSEIADLKKKTGRTPRVINLMLGKDDGACAYANSQRKIAEAIGIEYRLTNFPIETTQDKLIAQIHQFNQDKEIHGIMLHKPIPAHVDYRKVANEINIAKDLEGVNVANIGRMILGETRIIPCTPAAVMAHIKSTEQNLYGKEAPHFP